MCPTKLEVGDGIEPLKLCIGYKIDGRNVDIFPVGAEDAARRARTKRRLEGKRRLRPYRLLKRQVLRPDALARYRARSAAL